MAYDPVEEGNYNNRAAVPGHGDYIAAWKSRSADYRMRARCELDLAYGAGASERLDLFLPDRPDAGALMPLHVFIHGGYWQAMDKADFSYLAEPFVARGAAFAVVNYALAPAVGLDEIVTEMRSAMAWLYASAARFGYEASRIHVSGHSAGGHLVAVLMATDWRGIDSGIAADLVKSGLSISGLFDLRPLLATSINDRLGLDAAMARTLSPVHMQPRAGGPLVLAVGGSESAGFHDQGRWLAEAWHGCGPQLEHMVCAGCHHFSVLDCLADADDPLFLRAASLMWG